MLRRTMLTLTLLVVAGAPAVHVQSQKASPSKQSQKVSESDSTSLNLSAYAELLRSDLRTQKVAIITEVVGFTEDEDKVFWPLYREYEADLAKLGDERLAMIKDYATRYSELTDADANRLGGQALDLEARRQSLKAGFYDKVRKAISPRTALRYLQVEQQIQLIIDLQVAASLPVAGK